MVGWDAALTRIATWVKLQDKKTGQILMVVNTHFDHIGTEARRNSALLIIEKIKEIVGTSPAILTGDFNVSEDWDAYKTMWPENGQEWISLTIISVKYRPKNVKKSILSSLPHKSG